MDKKEHGKNMRNNGNNKQAKELKKNPGKVQINDWWSMQVKNFLLHT